MRLLSIVKPRDRLIVIKRTAPFRKQLNMLTIALALVVLVLVGYAFAVRTRPGLIIFAIIAGIIMLALLVRAYDLRRLAENEDSFCFDRESDTLLHNGAVVAPLTDIDHILVRQIVPEDDLTPDTGQYALVVALEDTRRITLAETIGVPEAKKDIEEAAQEIASFLNVKVEEGQRTETEWWVDR